MNRLRIAQIAPVATALPPQGSGSVELVTWLLTEGLVTRGHDVTLFATGDTTTSATLAAVYPHGYWHDESMWPWELYEMLNLSAAVERARDFDVIHFQAAYYPMSLGFGRLCAVPLLQTLHHSPSPEEVRLWSRYPEAPFVAISSEQARLLNGLNVVGTVLHGIDTDSFAFRDTPEDYVMFLGRFTDGKGVLQAIDIAKRAGLRIVLAAPEDEYYTEKIAPLVDGERVVYAGEVGHARKVELLGGARALLYPVQSGEPFGLVLAEAMACGTPVAALDRGAVCEVIEDGVTGIIFPDEDAMLQGLPRVFALDRRTVRQHGAARFGAMRMVDEYVDTYRQLIEARHSSAVLRRSSVTQ
ncbi:MAG: glycosyltransferase family 4 protein [Vicinamibacterales bacterium]